VDHDPLNSVQGKNVTIFAQISQDMYYFNFANVPFEDSSEAISASNVFLCACCQWF